MSMPEMPKPDPDFTQDQALTMILSSIALEEMALSHIMEAEGEKIQYILTQTCCGDCSVGLEGILAVNKSVAALLEVVLQNQMILKNKMEKVLEYLPRPPKPPCPPIPPCPEKCRPCKDTVCFNVIPKTYCNKEPLQWIEQTICGHFGLLPGDCSKIKLPRTGLFEIDIAIELVCSAPVFGEGRLLICCQDKPSIERRIFLSSQHGQRMLCKKTLVQMPCSCSPCYASVLICGPCGMCIRQGRITFRKL